MAEAVAAVALLFDDADLGEQLRDALKERGARIVHEGPLAGLSRELLSSLDADVLVVNLDDGNDSALDRLDEALEGERPRVVFNDAQASRELAGWDHARWARHLAMKVLAMGDADPPRPVAVAAEAAVEREAAPATAEREQAGSEPSSLDDTPLKGEEARQAAASETLAAELEAMLASDAPMADADAFDAEPDYAEGDGTRLDGGSFGLESLEHAGYASAESQDVVAEFPAGIADFAASYLAASGASTPVIESPVHASFQLDHLALVPAEESVLVAPAADGTAGPAAASPASASWALFEHDAPAPAAERPDPADFGIEKLSAADFLAPDAAAGESPVIPGLSLELVSLEEALAPQHFDAHEMVLDVPASALPRLVLLGATTESTAAVGEFLAALPGNLGAAVLHTQHLAGRPADGLVEYFASQCALPVRLAEPGMRAHVDEVIVVPSDRQVVLHRDGTVELQPIEEGAAHVPSIDVSFTQAANVFGRDAVAIVFAGRSTDAVGGCQAVHDRGGQVWVEASGGGHGTDMVSGVLAERLSHHAGTPRELAARLVEQFQEGQP